MPSAQARARESLAIATPFEVGESPAGNYLAALVAGAERDTTAAATFYREALRFDPRNPNLIERAFIAAVSNGNMQDAAGLAGRLVSHDPKNGVARLVLGIKAIKAKRFAAARAHFTAGGISQQHDVTSTLLTAWTYAGGHDTRRALSLLDKLKGENVQVFRDYHAALIAGTANDSQETLRRVKSAYAADKNTLRLVDTYARTLARHGDRAEAVRAYQSFDERYPNNPIVTAGLADIESGKPVEPLVKN
ncbi:MAG: tetratricopeptide repeat protein, partial [Beijerinckiaceae bacterium]|nr:tetratricopeptide repeat protein [Beijerinckiaceae bacterium]